MGRLREWREEQSKRQQAISAGLSDGSSGRSEEGRGDAGDDSKAYELGR